jgi:hypothetical protein
VSDGDTFFSPTVSQGTVIQELLPTLVANDNTFYAAVVSISAAPQTDVQGAPWWEVEKAKKQKELDNVLKNTGEEWEDETIALLLLKAA